MTDFDDGPALLTLAPGRAPSARALRRRERSAAGGVDADGVPAGADWTPVPGDTDQMPPMGNDGPDVPVVAWAGERVSGWQSACTGAPTGG